MPILTLKNQHFTAGVPFYMQSLQTLGDRWWMDEFMKECMIYWRVTTYLVEAYFIQRVGFQLKILYSCCFPMNDEIGWLIYSSHIDAVSVMLGYITVRSSAHSQGQQCFSQLATCSAYYLNRDKWKQILYC